MPAAEHRNNITNMDSRQLVAPPEEHQPAPPTSRPDPSQKPQAASCLSVLGVHPPAPPVWPQQIIPAEPTVVQVHGVSLPRPVGDADPRKLLCLEAELLHGIPGLVLMASLEHVVLVPIHSAIRAVVARLLGPVAHLVDALELVAHGTSDLMLAHLRLLLVVMETSIALGHLVSRGLEQEKHLVVHVLVGSHAFLLQVAPIIILLIRVLLALILELARALEHILVLLVKDGVADAEAGSNTLAVESGERRMVVLSVLRFLRILSFTLAAFLFLLLTITLLLELRSLDALQRLHPTH
mmetsp:Transcript_72635/g.151691  ORF Transcript_72635/g.151691 Transcript_72635/m.151691 type:complete len:296 (+) Transcript_72635:473-1360(+)